MGHGWCLHGFTEMARVVNASFRIGATGSKTVGKGYARKPQANEGRFWSGANCPCVNVARE